MSQPLTRDGIKHYPSQRNVWRRTEQVIVIGEEAVNKNVRIGQHGGQTSYCAANILLTKVSAGVRENGLG
jgi:hypothetical protein